MSVTWYLTTDDTDDRSLNVSNTNFCKIMDLIGLPIEDPDDMMGEFDPHTFAERITFALDSLRAMPALDGGTQSRMYEAHGPEGYSCRVIECGQSEGYYTDRLTRLLDIVREAQRLQVPVRYS